MGASRVVDGITYYRVTLRGRVIWVTVPPSDNY